MKSLLPINKCPVCSSEFSDKNYVDLEVELICLHCGFWCRLEEHYFNLDSLNKLREDYNLNNNLSEADSGYLKPLVKLPHPDS